MKANGFIETVDGKDFVRFKLNVKIRIDSARFYMDNLFNGQSSHMNAFGNKIINEHHKIFVRELLPGLESSLSKIFTKIINNILETATLDEMFPEWFVLWFNFYTKALLIDIIYIFQVLAPSKKLRCFFSIQIIIILHKLIFLTNIWNILLNIPKNKNNFNNSKTYRSKHLFIYILNNITPKKLLFGQ